MDEKMKKFIPLIFVAGLAFIGFIVYVIINRLGMATTSSQGAGFMSGFWHGAIVIVSFITGLFDKNIAIYQIGNSGVWYNLGYIIGLTIALGGSAQASKNKKKSNKKKPDCC